MKGSSLPNKLINRRHLEDLYIFKKRSVAQIAKYFKCSQNKINYWLVKFGIQKRSISEAMYQLKNPLGDPFKFKKPKNLKQGILFGLGLGLFWGEGTKRGKGGMRITNTDANMMRKYLEFLDQFFGIKRTKLKFSILIFNDIDETECLNYWCSELNVDRKQFYKTIVVKVRGKGTYKNKSRYGVIIVQFNNVRLKKILCDMIEKIE